MNTLLKTIIAAGALVTVSATPAFAAVPGQSLQGAVQSALSGGNVSVFLKDGVATLVGRTDDTQEKYQVLSAARNFEGVEQVRDLIHAD